MPGSRIEAGRARLETRPWWHGAVFYRVETRSFADSNGDGVGDLNGLRGRLGYLDMLGIDALWLTALMDRPIDRPGVGRAVDPMLGDVHIFQRLLDEAHDSGIRVAIDVGVSRDAVELPGVREEVSQALRFWMERGVDGFRVGAAPGTAMMADAAVHKIVSMIRPTVDEFPQVGIGALVDGSWYSHYAHPDDLDLGVDLRFSTTTFTAASIQDMIETIRAPLISSPTPPVWTLAGLSPHRPVSRYGGGRIGVARARAIALVELALPGTIGIDNGEELGLPDADRPGQAGVDPVRSPMPWEGSRPPYGFSDAAEDWWPASENWASLTAEAQLEDPGSTLSLYRQALATRRTHPGFWGSDIQWFGAPPGCLAFRRTGSTLTCALNTSAFPVPLPPGRLLLSSSPITEHELPPDTAVWLD